jgi:DNA-binding IclR family transcriptional regulator
MKAYLAWSDEKAIEHWLDGWRATRYSPSTPTTLEEIRKELLATRLRGYSRSIGEFTEGLTALALPIFNRAGKVAYILNSMGISTAMAPIEHQVAEQMITTISEIHRLIGSNAPASFPTALPSVS